MLYDWLISDYAFGPVTDLIDHFVNPALVAGWGQGERADQTQTDSTAPRSPARPGYHLLRAAGERSGLRRSGRERQ